FMEAAAIGRIVEAIRNHPSRARNKERDADIILLFYYLGIRRAEASRMTAQDIDWANQRIFVHGKCGNRYLPISEECKPVLARMVARAKGKSIFGHRRKLNPIFR